DVAERALERAAAPREDLEVVLEAAVLPPELLLREGRLVEVVLERSHLVAVDGAVLLDPEGRDGGVVLAALHPANQREKRDLTLPGAHHVDVEGEVALLALVQIGRAHV